MSIGRRMAQWVNDLKYEDLPEKTVHEVKRRVIDSIGASVGAFWSRPAKVARAKAMAASDPPPSATVWGTTHHTPPDLAAFANGTMVRYLDCNDTYLNLECAHPSANIPVAVGVAQTAGKNGKDVILATVIGYEIQCRLCDVASLRAGGWDDITYGALSTALVAGKLWNLTEDQLDTAILVSLFTDRRAEPYEVVKPQLRRGWIGDLETPEDLYGSMLWLFEQSRLTGEVVSRIGGFGKSCLDWMLRDSIATEVSARAIVRSSRVDLRIDIKKPNSPAEARVFALWENTGRG